MAKHFEFDVTKLKYRSYGNNRLALILEEPDGERIATLSVNIPELPVEDNQVFIKDYSENEGVLADLIEHDIVTPIIEVPTGMASVMLCHVPNAPKDGS